MQHRHLVARLMSTVALCACSTASVLGRAEQSCLKYPTPTARAECEARVKADNAAFLKESQKNAEAPSADAKGEVPKKSGLCFKRKSTGEVVCPN